MNKIIIVLLSLFLFSCHSVDKKDIKSVAETVEKGLQENNFTIIETVFGKGLNSLDKYSKENMQSILEVFKDSKKVQGVKIEVDELKQDKVIKIFFKKDDEFYRTRTYFKYNDIKEIQPFEFHWTNLSVLCNSRSKLPYIPENSIDFKRIVWRFDNSQQVFREGSIELKNNTDNEINLLKFKVSLMYSTQTNDIREFYNKTIEYKKSIPKGDIVQIKLKDLEDYYTGFSINANNLLFETKVIEAKPKPTQPSCLEIIELKDSYRKMIEYQNRK